MSAGAHPILSVSVSQLAEKQRKDIDDISLADDVRTKVLSQFVPKCFDAKPTSHIISGDHTIFRNNGRLANILHPGKQSADHWKRSMEPGSIKSNGLQSLLPNANGLLVKNDDGVDMELADEELVETGSIHTAVKSSLTPVPAISSDDAAPSPTFDSGPSSDEDDDQDDDSDDDDDDDDDDDSSLAKFVVDDDESGSDGEFSPSDDDEDEDGSDDDEDDDDDDKPVAGTSFHPHTTHADVSMDDVSSSDSDMTPPPSPKKPAPKKAPASSKGKSPPKVVLKDFPPLPDDCKAAFVRLAMRETDASNPVHMAAYHKYLGPQRDSLKMVRTIQTDSTTFPKLMKALNMVALGYRVSLYDPEPGHKVCELTDTPSTQMVKMSLFNRKVGNDDSQWVHKHVCRDAGMLLFMADAAIYASTLLCEPSANDELAQLGEHVADFYWKSYQFLQAYHDAIQTR